MRWSVLIVLAACKGTADPASPLPTEPDPVSTPECEAMLACDAALDAAVPAYTSVFEGGNDPVYGPDGTCYTDFGLVGCSEECLDVYAALIDAVATFIVLGELNDVPQGCIADIQLPTPPVETGDTDEPPPPTPPPFSWTVTLTDGDQVADSPGGSQDADTLAVTIANGVANYPEVVEWDFGYGQTEIGSSTGWFGEDCNGIVDIDDICHTMDTDSTMVLNRVFSLNDIVPGQTTLLPVDYPESQTPGVTYVIHGYTATDLEVECWSMGHQPSYYSGIGCQELVP